MKEEWRNGEVAQGKEREREGKLPRRNSKRRGERGEESYETELKEGRKEDK